VTYLDVVDAFGAGLVCGLVAAAFRILNVR
jgi:hypothetical protein